MEAESERLILQPYGRKPKLIGAGNIQSHHPLIRYATSLKSDLVEGCATATSPISSR
jgi:hypothetical protein